jgi:hypothetical protein
MEKSTTFKVILFSLPLFLLILFGMIWYNAHYIQKTDKEYSNLIESAGISSNALTQTAINTSYAMHQCALMVLADDTRGCKMIVHNLDSIRKQNSNLIDRLNEEAKTKEQKEKLEEFIIVRAKLSLQRDSLVKLVANNQSKNARDFYFDKMGPNFSQFFHIGSAYLGLVDQNIKSLNNELTKRNATIVKINEYLFWLPIVALGLLITLILFIFFRVYSITKDELDY